MTDYMKKMLMSSARCLQRTLLFERRNNIVMPFKETVQQVVSRISAFRDAHDGPQVSPRCNSLHIYTILL